MYEVQAIINHRDTSPNYEYLVIWKNFTEAYDSWESPESFDSPDVTKHYWARVDANKQSKDKGKQPTHKSVNTRKIATREEKSNKKRERLLAEEVI